MNTEALGSVVSLLLGAQLMSYLFVYLVLNRMMGQKLFPRKDEPDAL
jgi:hypothetical protein